MKEPERTDDLLCLTCIYYLGGNRCMAFPGGVIPDDILEGKNDHSKPVKGQFSDYVYEEVDIG